MIMKGVSLADKQESISPRTSPANHMHSASNLKHSIETEKRKACSRVFGIPGKFFICSFLCGLIGRPFYPHGGTFIEQLGISSALGQGLIQAKPDDSIYAELDGSHQQSWTALPRHAHGNQQLRPVLPEQLVCQFFARLLT